MQGKITGMITRILLEGKCKNTRDMKKMNEVSVECKSQHYS